LHIKGDTKEQKFPFLLFSLSLSILFLSAVLPSSPTVWLK
jgi:hypothetical protein